MTIESYIAIRFVVERQISTSSDFKMATSQSQQNTEMNLLKYFDANAIEQMGRENLQNIVDRWQKCIWTERFEIILPVWLRFKQTLS